MLKNYLVVAWRNLLRYKLYSLINIAGLATGMACCLLVALFVYDEWSYDRFHENAGRIYRVLREVKTKDGSVAFDPKTSGALAPRLEDIPEVERALRVWNKEEWYGTSVSYGDKSFDHGFCVAEAELLEVFDFPLVEGDAQTALRVPASVLLTQEMAQKYFGDEDPLGKVLKVDDNAFEFDGDYTITGVLRDMPRNSTLRFPFLTTHPQGKYGMTHWREGRPGTGGPVETYILARKGYDREALERHLAKFGTEFADDPETGFIAYHLQPLTEIYLYSRRDYGLDKSGDYRGYGHITYVYQIGAVAFASATVATPPWWSGGKIMVRPEGLAERQMGIAWVDEDFLETFAVELLAGRNFSRDIASDAEEAFLINETAVAHLGWDEPLGKTLAINDREGVIVGVVKDFHTGSLREPIPPLVLGMRSHWDTLTLRFGPGDFASTLAFVEQTERRFVDGNYGYWDSVWSHDWLYRNEQRFGRIFRLVSYLSIFVACLGLFGLASFAAQKRTKEIGIRKVLGASGVHIAKLFMVQFAGLVLLGNALAWPLAYYVMEQWLRDFAYRVDLGLSIFLLGSSITLSAAALSVSVQILRSMRLNPVEALRSE